MCSCGSGSSGISVETLFNAEGPCTPDRIRFGVFQRTVGPVVEDRGGPQFQHLLVIDDEYGDTVFAATADRAGAVGVEDLAWHFFVLEDDGGLIEPTGSGDIGDEFSLVFVPDHAQDLTLPRIITAARECTGVNEALQLVPRDDGHGSIHATSLSSAADTLSHRIGRGVTPHRG
jgi:hypothetical protein